MPTVSGTYEHTNPVTGEDCEDEIEVDITISGGDPGKYYGPPETCWEASDPDVEFDNENMIRPDSCSVCNHVYSFEEKNEIEAIMVKALQDFDVGEYLNEQKADYDEGRYEDQRNSERYG